MCHTEYSSFKCGGSSIISMCHNRPPVTRRAHSVSAGGRVGGVGRNSPLEISPPRMRPREGKSWTNTKWSCDVMSGVSSRSCTGVHCDSLRSFVSVRDTHRICRFDCSASSSPSSHPSNASRDSCGWSWSQAGRQTYYCLCSKTSKLDWVAVWDICTCSRVWRARVVCDRASLWRDPACIRRVLPPWISANHRQSRAIEPRAWLLKQDV